MLKFIITSIIGLYGKILDKICRIDYDNIITIILIVFSLFNKYLFIFHIELYFSIIFY